MSKWYGKQGLMALALMAAGTANAAAVYTETDWTDALATLAFVLPLPNTVSSFSLSGAGNPGNALQFSTSITAPAHGSNASVGIVLSPNTVHDGEASPVEEIAWSRDVLVNQTGANGGQGEIAAFYIAQMVGGSLQMYFHYSQVSSLQAGVWQTIGDVGLVADDFVLMDLATLQTDPGAHPDFGALMVFGFGTGAGFTNNSNLTATSTITFLHDNFTVTVTPAATPDPDPNPVPLPATWLLLGGGFLAAAGTRRRPAIKVTPQSMLCT